MFFVLLSIALAVIAAGGLYLRWRLVRSLQCLGASERGARRVGRIVLWLVFAYPVYLFSWVFLSIAMGADSMSLGHSGFLYWTFELPFWVSLLVMLQCLPWYLLTEIVGLAARRIAPAERRRRSQAWACLAVLGLLTIYTPVRIWMGTDDLELHRHQFGEGQGPPLRLLFMGDLQLGQHVSQEQVDTLLDAARGEGIEVIISGGDWIDSGAEYIDEAAQVAGELRALHPVLSVRGDHEHFAYQDQERSVEEVRAALEAVEVELIDNELRWFERGGKRIAIAFVNYNYIVRSERAQVDALLDAMEGADYAVAVTHQLDATLASWLEERVDLVLAAHTHGGQVSPLVGLWHVPVARVETPYVRGRYRLSKRTYVLVTAGIGYSMAPFRYASPGSIELVEIRP